MSDSVWPHRRQPTRLSRPWDSPGKNTGVGCHCLLQCMKVKSEVAQLLSHVLLLVTPWTAAYQAPPSMGFSRQECWSGVPLPSPLFSSLHPSYLKMLLHCLAYIVSHEKYADSAFCSFVYNMPVFSLATFFFRPLSMQDLSSQIRDGIRIPCFGNLES